MFNIKMSVATAILILVAINSVSLGYLSSRVAYDANLAETSLKQNSKILNHTYELVKQSHDIVNNTENILTNQMFAILKQMNTTQQSLNHSLVLLRNITKS